VIGRQLIDAAIGRGVHALSERDSKTLLAEYGVPVAREILAASAAEAEAAATELGLPVAVKGCGEGIAHKTELGLVRLDIASPAAVHAAAAELLRHAPGVLVQEMVRGERAFMLGMVRDPQFGPCVSFGLGGVLAEVLADSALRVAPLTVEDALEMLAETRAGAMLSTFRGMPDVDPRCLADALVALGRIALEHPQIAEIDVNPVIAGSQGPRAVDALVVLDGAPLAA
jgi:acetyl-CoA synthetase (ADP-forming)